eukprot:1319409-Prymnesium_polylepis.1
MPLRSPQGSLARVSLAGRRLRRPRRRRARSEMLPHAPHSSQLPVGRARPDCRSRARARAPFSHAPCL